MLILSRMEGERVYIGADIALTVVAVSGGRVKIGIEAPRGVAVLREELLPHPLTSTRKNDPPADAS